MDVEPTDDEKMAGYLSTIESGEASDDESIKAKEAAVLALSALYAKRRESEKLAALLNVDVAMVRSLHVSKIAGGDGYASLEPDLPTSVS